MWRCLPALLFLLLFFPCHGKSVRYVYDYNDRCSQAYQSFMSLHLPEGHAMVTNELQANPDNLMCVYISDYEDCLELLLNCDKDRYEQCKDHFDERIELLDKGDESSPWYRFCKAGVYLHWALINTRFGDQYQAALKFHRSFSLLKENQRLFPGFEYNQVFAGLEEAVVGSLPGNYKWLASVFGMKGNLKKGTTKLDAFIRSHTEQQPLYLETVLYNAYTRFYLLSEQKQVWDFLSGPGFSTTGNLLNAYVKTNIALDFRKSDAALEILRAAAADPAFINYPIFEYQMGLALQTKSDFSCVDCFEKYIEHNRNDLYVKECWQKMAWEWYLVGDNRNAAYCRAQIRLHGSSRIDADRQAEKFAESSAWPSKKLLQARLLTDGGYYNRAFTMLSDIDWKGSLNAADQVEYFFRLARVYEELGDTKRALEYYQYTMNAGRERHEQFAARAALQMGKLYEHAGMPSKAVFHYKQCLDMPTHDFQNSIDQQAKAGINRVEGN